MIYFDQSEGREGTRLPSEIIKHGQQITGLENVTGADLLLVEGDVKLSSVSREMPNPLKERLYAATSRGVLVARKSGNDLLGSIGQLDHVLARMLAWCGVDGEAWLVSTGKLSNKYGMAVVDGRKSDIRYMAVMSAVVAWQRRGGYWAHLDSDGDLIDWCYRWEGAWFSKPETKVVRPVAQVLVLADWWHKLTSVPGLGLASAEAVGRWLPDGYKTLANALQYLSWKGYYRADDHPEGIGPMAFEKVREWLGLEAGQSLEIRDNLEE